MHLEMQRCENPSHLKHDRWDLALVGTTVDDRSEASIGYARVTRKSLLLSNMKL